MSKVIANMSMSLDGFVDHPTDGVNHLFAWYGNGDVEFRTANPTLPTFRLSKASADNLRETFDSLGALVCGRRVYDQVGGWGGVHPLGTPVFIVTHNAPEKPDHPDAPFTFVTDGIHSAIEQAKAAADGKDIAVATPDIVRQCLNAGLLDEITIDLVPVLLGDGTRFFDGLDAITELDGPEVVQGTGVTHLKYRVVK